MKIAATILISTFLVLVLFAMYQYKAKNRQWGITMMWWLALTALLVGMKIRFNSFMVPIFLGFGFCLAYFIGWRLIGNRLSGWRRHLARGTVFGICLGPLVAVRLVDLERCFRWMEQNNSHVDGATVIRFLLFGLPGFLLVGSFVFLFSLIADLMNHGMDESWKPPKHWKLTVPAVSVLLLLCINWYVAGTMHLHSLIQQNAEWLPRYIAVSRPGIGDSKADYPNEQALCTAIKSEDAILVRLLVWGGADVTGKANGVRPWEEMKRKLPNHQTAHNIGGRADGYTSSPLHYAVLFRNRELTQFLIEHGAPINTRNGMGATPLDIVLDTYSPFESMSEPFVAWLREQGAKTGYCIDYPLHSAAAFDDVEAVAALLSRKFDVNGKDRLGRTPMHLAAIGNRTAIIDGLVTAGGTVDAQDESRDTPLIFATKRGHRETVTVLLRHGADILAEGLHGKTALHFGAELGREEVVETLLRAGANPNGAARPLPPLSMAIFHAAQTLRKSTAREDRRRRAFATADLLIENGASINTLSDGKTILELSMLMLWPKEITDYLRRHGGKTSTELGQEEKKIGEKD